MKTYTCNICNESGFTSPQKVGAHKRTKHPEQTVHKKKLGRPPKNPLAVTVISSAMQPPSIEGVKYCPECGHFLLPYTAALTAMKGRRS